MESKEMEPKKWLRCNSCFCLMCKDKEPFSLLFCGHVFCSKCLRKAKQQCPQCKNQNVPAMSLSEPLKSEIKHCFESVDELFEKLRQATLFQTTQYSLNCKRLNQFEKKYAFAKEEYGRKSNEVKRAIENIRQLERRIQELETVLESSRKMRELRNSSTVMTPYSNISLMTGSVKSDGSFDSSRNDGYSFVKPQNFHQSRLTPTTLQQMNLNGEFRIPSITKVARSFGGSSRASLNSSKASLNSSRASLNSSRGTPFSNYTPFSDRR